MEKRVIKYTELPAFSEVVRVGTSLILTSVKFITRHHCTADRPSASSRVQADGDSEVVTYLSEEQLGAGPIWMNLFAQLQGIQQGKLKDEWGWRFFVQAADQIIEGCNGHVENSQTA